MILRIQSMHINSCKHIRVNMIMIFVWLTKIVSIKLHPNSIPLILDIMTIKIVYAMIATVEDIYANYMS